MNFAAAKPDMRNFIRTKARAIFPTDENRVTRNPSYKMTVDLESQTISDALGFSEHFDVDPFRRHLLLNGLDDIALTLQNEADITAYETTRPAWKRGTKAAA